MKLLKFSENYIPLVFSYHLKSLTHDKILNSDEVSERIDFLLKQNILQKNNLSDTIYRCPNKPMLISAPNLQLRFQIHAITLNFQNITSKNT